MKTVDTGSRIFYNMIYRHKIDFDNDGRPWTFYSMWIDLTAPHTAEINDTAAGQSAVFGLHIKVHARFLPHSVV